MKPLTEPWRAQIAADAGLTRLENEAQKLPQLRLAIQIDVHLSRLGIAIDQPCSPPRARYRAKFRFASRKPAGYDASDDLGFLNPPRWRPARTGYDPGIYDPNGTVPQNAERCGRG
jgi:hypothetical protein